MVRPVPRPPSPEDDAESAALRYWREQEQSPLPDTDVSAQPGDDVLDGTLSGTFADVAEDAFPSGWWILPVLILSCLTWGGVGALVLL